MVMQVIKTQKQYMAAMARLDELMVMDFQPATSEANEFEVLTVLIEKFESETVDLGPIDPIEAIKFRLDQDGKTQRALTPYIGSASKVSEVMNGKRPLSLKMIRALHKHLGISYDALLAEKNEDVGLDLEWEAFPLKEMLARNLLRGYEKISDVRGYEQECVQGFFGNRFANRFPEAQLAARHKTSARTGRPMNRYSLMVWHELSVQQAEKKKTEGSFELSALDDDLFEELATLSIFEKGPLLAEELLSKKGVRVVHVKHFPKTYLDGAALILEDVHRAPVISLTGRHDRLDNYWYVLFHELAHVRKHLYKNSESREAIYDNLDVSSDEEIEKEADDLAMFSLVSEKVRSALDSAKTAAEVLELAAENKRSPAIYAGYLRKKRENYRVFNNLVGRGEISAMFG